jgi:hypothetical protein
MSESTLRGFDGPDRSAGVTPPTRGRVGWVDPDVVESLLQGFGAVLSPVRLLRRGSRAIAAGDMDAGVVGAGSA